MSSIKLNKTQQSRLQGVIQAGLNNGLSLNQARIFAAQVGRENGFNDGALFGSHGDANNKQTNFGFISWQGTRRTNLLNRLNRAGLMNPDGTAKRSQATLDAMMGFALDEMRTVPAYKKTRDVFLNNPDVDYNTAERVLGTNYIRWDYAGKKINAAQHKARQDEYYRLAGGTQPMAVSGSNAGYQGYQADYQAADNGNDGYQDYVQPEPVSLADDGGGQNHEPDMQTAENRPEDDAAQYVKNEEAFQKRKQAFEIQPLTFGEPSDSSHAYEDQMAQAFGTYPDMKGQIPDELDMLIQSIYDEV